jgi:hypothetical protein
MTYSNILSLEVVIGILGFCVGHASLHQQEGHQENRQRSTPMRAHIVGTKKIDKEAQIISSNITSYQNLAIHSHGTHYLITKNLLVHMIMEFIGY